MYKFNIRLSVRLCLSVRPCALPSVHPSVRPSVYLPPLSPSLSSPLPLSGSWRPPSSNHGYRSNHTDVHLDTLPNLYPIHTHTHTHGNTYTRLQGNARARATCTPPCWLCACILYSSDTAIVGVGDPSCRRDIRYYIILYYMIEYLPSCRREIRSHRITFCRPKTSLSQCAIPR
jgi:hypothetical protein